MYSGIIYRQSKVIKRTRKKVVLFDPKNNYNLFESCFACYLRIIYIFIVLYFSPTVFFLLIDTDLKVKN